MVYLFDASSLVVLIRREGRKADEQIGEARILDLTRYELGNWLWKEVTILKSVTRDEAKLLATKALSTLKRIPRIATGDGDFVETLGIASKEHLTFYDASYIQAARQNKLTLVTEDRALARASCQYVPTKNVVDILS